MKAELTRKKMSEAKKLNWQKQDYRENAIKKHTGKKQSPITISKRVLKNTGQKRTPDKICIVCGVVYRPHGKRKKISKFCSHKCKGIWMTEHPGPSSPNYRGGGVIKICKMCGKDYTIEKSRINISKFCSRSCKGKWLVKEGIVLGPHPMYGSDHPGWKGGISFEPYCPKFNNEFKERVRAFFDYQCLNCGSPQNGEKLHIHHVKFDKETCCNESIPLFVPLCRSCHSKSTHNRESSSKYFTEIIQNYYQSKCYFSKEEMQLYNYNTIVSKVLS